MMRHLIKKSLVATMTVAMLSSCGFHLRGSSDAPGYTRMDYQTLAIVGDQQSNVTQNLINIMHGQVQVVPATAHPQVTVELTPAEYSRAIQTKSIQGTVTEYRLYASVTMQAYDTDRNILISPVRLTTARSLTAGNGYATSIDLEEARLSESMSVELANQVQYRLRAIRLNTLNK